MIKIFFIFLQYILYNNNKTCLYFLEKITCKFCKIVYNIKEKCDLKGGEKMNSGKLKGFTGKYKYKFKNIELLKTALTHTSYAYDHEIQSNEKLEFFG